MSEDRQRHRYAPEPRRWYRTTWFAAVAVVVFVAVVMIVAVIPVWATDTPSYCSSCKTMQPAGESWQRSVHSSVSCTDCHVPPGLANDTKWRTRELLNIWADYLNVPQTADRRQRPGNENCLKCHNVDNIPEDNGSVRMPHDAHLNLRNLTCADCHSQVAHPEEGKTGTEISMAVCSMCHEEATSTTACMFCHLEPQAKDVHPKGYMRRTANRRVRTSTPACAVTTARPTSVTRATPNPRPTTSPVRGVTTTARRPSRIATAVSGATARPTSATSATGSGIRTTGSRRTGVPAPRAATGVWSATRAACATAATPARG